MQSELLSGEAEKRLGHKTIRTDAHKGKYIMYMHHMHHHISITQSLHNIEEKNNNKVIVKYVISYESSNCIASMISKNIKAH